MFFKKNYIMEQEKRIIDLHKKNIELIGDSLKLRDKLEKSDEVYEIAIGVINELKPQVKRQHEYIEKLKADIKDSKHTEEILRESMLGWRKRFFEATSPLKKEILKLTRELQSAETIIALGDDTNKVLNDRIQAVYDLVRPL